MRRSLLNVALCMVGLSWWGGCATTDAAVPQVVAGAAVPVPEAPVPVRQTVPVAAAIGEAAGPGDLVVRFFRPAGCGERRRVAGRQARDCRLEEQRVVVIRSDGRVDAGPGREGPARNPVPDELFRQWRTCPMKRVEALESLPDRFVVYEDPDVGPCYILRDRDPGAVEALRRPARLAMLDGLHPYLADATLRMIVAARAEGIDVKVISGVRPWGLGAVWKAERVLRKGKWVKVRTKHVVNRSALHAWGLAVDVNLSHRDDLRSATAAFLAGGKERRAWDRLGALGEEFGLEWLGRSSAREIFHFEWHPTLPGWPRGDLDREMHRRDRKGGLGAVWEMLRRDPKRPGTFAGLRDPTPERTGADARGAGKR